MDMDDEPIIRRAVEEVGQEIGRLQGRLFAVEAESESLRTRIRRLDAVYQNLLIQKPQKQTASAEEALRILNTELPVLDPESRPVCQEIIELLTVLGRLSDPEAQRQFRQTAIARMESRAWKQGEAIALAQKVVLSLRD